MNEKAQTPEKSVIIYSYSPVFYWWPLWLLGFILAGASYIGGDSLAWNNPSTPLEEKVTPVVMPGSVEKAQDDSSQPDGSPVEAKTDSDAKMIHLSRNKSFGFLFAIVFCFVFFHSNVLWRGYRAYFFLATGLVALLALMLIHTTFPDLGLWAWVTRVVYFAPDIYVSADGYMFISSLVLAVWLFVIFVYNRWTYMRFESGQVRMVEEVGEGENVFDTTNMTFEKQKEDVFRHYILGLGFLRPLRHVLPRVLARPLEAMTGTGDLIVRVGGDADKVIIWSNVLNIDSKLEEITTLIKSRRVVQS